jgi:hypothetical protein
MPSTAQSVAARRAHRDDFDIDAVIFARWPVVRYQHAARAETRIDRSDDDVFHFRPRPPLYSILD